MKFYKSNFCYRKEKRFSLKINYTYIKVYTKKKIKPYKNVI